MITNYETDVVAWANEQASLIRAGRFDRLDLKLENRCWIKLPLIDRVRQSC